MPEDIFFKYSRKIYSKLGVDYEGYTSPLSLVEIAGVISTRLSEFPTELMPIKVRKKLQNLSSDEIAMSIRLILVQTLKPFETSVDTNFSTASSSLVLLAIVSTRRL